MVKSYEDRKCKFDNPEEKKAYFSNYYKSHCEFIECPQCKKLVKNVSYKSHCKSQYHLLKSKLINIESIII
jgi:hypothetical protein